jgi:hypothetical protein
MLGRRNDERRGSDPAFPCKNSSPQSSFSSTTPQPDREQAAKKPMRDIFTSPWRSPIPTSFPRALSLCRMPRRSPRPAYRRRASRYRPDRHRGRFGAGLRQGCCFISNGRKCGPAVSIGYNRGCSTAVKSARPGSASFARPWLRERELQRWDRSLSRTTRISTHRSLRRLPMIAMSRRAISSITTSCLG